MNNIEIINKNYAEAVGGIKEQWLTALNTKWYEYIVGLPTYLQITYLVVVLHNQVLNGGFHQYFVNGYGQFAPETINALNIIGASKKSDLLKQALKIVNAENKSDKDFRQVLLNKEITQLFSNDDLVDILDTLDTLYYANENENVEILLGIYLLS